MSQSDTRLPVPDARGRGDHLVQFYEDETFLAERVVRFLHQGLAAGDLITVIATASHMDSYACHLEALGVDVRKVRGTGQLTLLEAHETLAAFMRDGDPEPRLFQAAVGSVFEKQTAASPGARLRA